MRPSRAVAAAAVVAAALAGCNDDDAATTTSAAPVTSDVAATTTEPSTTLATTTSPPTTAAPTTTVDVEALKAQIAADYLKTAQALEDLVRNPTLDGLDEKLAAIAVPGSYSYTGRRSAIEKLIANGQRAAPGDPDYSDSTVESVEIVGNPADGRAVVTVCDVANQKIVDASGQQVGGLTSVTAAKFTQPMARTNDGWRQSDQGQRISIQENSTTCAP